MLEDTAPFQSDRPNQPWAQKCICGKTFMQPNSYGLHVGSCKKLKERLGKSLRAARDRRTVTTDSTSSINPLARKRKCGWLNDTNLDVDAVPCPSKATPSLQPSEIQLQDHNDASERVDANQIQDLVNPPLANEEPPELGRGLREKRLSYKIRPNNNILPSSALPASLYPSFQPSPLPPVPEATRALSEVPQTSLGTSETTPDGTESQSPPRATTTTTALNSFGLYKIYLSDSSDAPHDPDGSTLTSDLRESESSPVESHSVSSTSTKTDLHPFPNMSCFRLGEWYWSDDNGNSSRSFQDLLSIVGSDEFKPSDVRKADWGAIDRTLANSNHADEDFTPDSEEWWDDHGISWKSSSVTINVPLRKGLQNSGTHPFTLSGFHHRPLVPIIKEKLECSEGREYFHTLGHELRWKPGEGKADARVYGEMYNSQAFIDAYEELQMSPPEPDCELPRYVVGLMFASDATMLAAFGTAKIWPLYMFYANDSKYRRAKPSEYLFETIAYFEKLPDQFKDFVIELSGRETVTAPLITHCQRELFHEQWKILLDDEFIAAYCHGIVVKCYDGIKRRFYPRIFTYSADYPEKILLASIKNLGAFPCPRCNIPMKDVPAMGQKRDRRNRIRLARNDDETRQKKVSEARTLIYQKKYAVTSDVVEARLAEGSMVPSDNAFSHRLSSLGFNLFLMLVVDFMHEFELGVWKAIFIQLLRLLEAIDKGAINRLDKRYRDMPTFGKETIRRFVNNVSEMKRLAARDFEDLLQCAIPAFEDLLPSPHNATVMQLLFTLTEFHGLSKLRQHTDHTVAILDTLTTRLGDQLRSFVKNTCSKFNTKELAREYQARMRREARKKKPKTASSKRRKTSSGQVSAAPEPTDADSSNSRTDKTLNLNTYKFHSLGDIVPAIKMFGTTDSYSTQTPEGFHRYPKRHYKRTSKRNVTRQLSRIQMRQARIRKLRKQLLPDPAEGYVDEDATQYAYFIGRSQNSAVNLPTFLQKKSADPAIKDFYYNLRIHLLPRVYGLLLQEAELPPAGGSKDLQRIEVLRSLVKAAESSNFLGTPEAQSDAEQIYFHSERIYEHRLFNINYTSYDVRRETDIVNPKTSRRDVMCLRTLDDDESPSTAHHFVHARVLGIFHTNVMYKGRGASDFCRRRFDFLFVRFFEFCESSASTTNLDRVRLLPVSRPGSIGFLDPTDVLRASHIVPRYSLGQLYAPGSAAGRITSKLAKDSDDWKEYYVNRFVDRDMVMRYHWGLGVGHVYSHKDAPTASESADIVSAPLNSDMQDDLEDGDDDTERMDTCLAEASGSAAEDSEEDESDEDNPEHSLDNHEENELDVAGEGYETDSDLDIQDADDEDSED